MSTQDKKSDGIESSSSVPTLDTSSSPFTDLRQPSAPELHPERNLEPRRLFAEPRADSAVEFLMNSIRRMQSEMETIKKENQEWRRTQTVTLTATQLREEKEREAKISEPVDSIQSRIETNAVGRFKPMVGDNELHHKDVNQRLGSVLIHPGQGRTRFGGEGENGSYATHESANADSITAGPSDAWAIETHSWG